MKNILFFLGQLTDLDADWLATNGQKVTLPPGGTLITEGQAADAISIVLDGELVVTLEAAGGAELGHAGPGEVVGEMSFISATLPSATVRASIPSEILQVPRARMSERLSSDDAFAARFYKAMAMMLSDRLRTANVRKGSGHAAGALEEDELDPTFLDSVSMAGDRFNQMLRRLSADR